jgi:NAD(P)-dependent dehydrogenase (short-subunit alcohol dehydrogenase family)
MTASQTPKRFIGKTVIVTGAGHGIGRAIAERFALEGASVVVNDINLERAEGVAAAINSGGGIAIAGLADVGDKSQVDAMFDLTLEKFGMVDVLVNNAAIASVAEAGAHFLNGDEAWWDRILRANLKSVYLCSHRAAWIMAPKRTGSIINFSSGGATKAHRGMASYDAAKGGVEALTRAMALDLAPYGIRVNCIVPGLIRTYNITDELALERGKVVPLGRLGTAEDLAGPTVFLATDDARYITGVCLPVEGGVLVQQRSSEVEVFPLSLFPVVPAE